MSKHQTQYSQLQAQIKEHNEYIQKLVERYIQFVQHKYNEHGIRFASKGLIVRGYEGADIYTHDYSVYVLNHRMKANEHSKYILKDDSVARKIEKLMSMRCYTNDYPVPTACG